MIDINAKTAIVTVELDDESCTLLPGWKVTKYIHSSHVGKYNFEVLILYMNCSI